MRRPDWWYYVKKLHFSTWWNLAVSWSDQPVLKIWHDGRILTIFTQPTITFHFQGFHFLSDLVDYYRVEAFKLYSRKGEFVGRLRLELHNNPRKRFLQAWRIKTFLTVRYFFGESQVQRTFWQSFVTINPQDKKINVDLRCCWLKGLVFQ